jgi:hypothetical protein
MNDQKKKIDIDQVLHYLTRAFANAQSEAVKVLGHSNKKGTELYDFQVDFMYLIHEIKRGPRYIAPMKISEANELIDRLSSVR